MSAEASERHVTALWSPEKISTLLNSKYNNTALTGCLHLFKPVLSLIPNFKNIQWLSLMLQVLLLCLVKFFILYFCCTRVCVGQEITWWNKTFIYKMNDKKTPKNTSNCTKIHFSNKGGFYAADTKAENSNNLCWRLISIC